MKVSDQIQQIQPSATMAITAKAKAMKAAGENVVTFGAGEPDFDTPDNIKKAAIKAIESGQTKYTAGVGTVEMRNSVVHRAKQDYDLDIDPSNVLISTGAKQSVYNLLRTAINPGDEVLVLSPYWVSYPDMIRLSGGEPVFVEGKFENKFVVEAEQIREKISAKTVGLIFNNPSNPSGVGYTREQQKEIAEVVLEHNLWVISDEIYDKLVYDDHEHVPFVTVAEGLEDWVATVGGVSKTYAMTGWRIGSCYGPTNWIKAASKLQGQSTSNASSISQAAACEAFSGPQEVVEQMRQAFAKRRELLVGLLNDIPGVTCLSPQGAFYVFPNISGVLKEGQTDLDWAAGILEDQKVALVPGSPFGAPGHVRLSYATSEEEISEGVRRIRAFIDSQK